MDTLDGTDWDMIISGTGLPQSLLALALSRSGKRILHLDRNDYYGGDEAALSLSEAEKWAQEHSGETSDASTFSLADFTRSDNGDEGSGRLGFSRAYSLALASHLVYSRSNLLKALVSSHVHNQLEFQAVGSWFTLTRRPDAPHLDLLRVPSGREDVFRDATLDIRSKRSLMRFLRFVGSYDEEVEREKWAGLQAKPFQDCLVHDFSLPSTAVDALLALALPSSSGGDLTMADIVPRIRRHLESIGLFGAGFAAVLPKYGGLAEVAQVACRACAVGGGVYVLGKGITDVVTVDAGLRLQLSGGETVTSRRLIGCPQDLPSIDNIALQDRLPAMRRGIYIIASPLESLFPRTSEGGPLPAGAVVVARATNERQSPVQILVHTSDSGECPVGQCVLYTCCSENVSTSEFNAVVESLLERVEGSSRPSILWKLHYTQTNRLRSAPSTRSSNIITLRPLEPDLVLDDEVLNDVERVWRILADEPQDTFMKFEAREGTAEDDFDAEEDEGYT